MAPQRCTILAPEFWSMLNYHSCDYVIYMIQLTSRWRDYPVGPNKITWTLKTENSQLVAKGEVRGIQSTIAGYEYGGGHEPGNAGSL